MSRRDQRTPPKITGMTSLKVDNLTYRTTMEDLKRYFGRYGEIGDVYIPRDPGTFESRGFAFIRFFDRHDAEEAIERMDGSMMDGRPLRVQHAKYGRPRTPPRRGVAPRRRELTRGRSRTRSRSGSRGSRGGGRGRADRSRSPDGRRGGGGRDRSRSRERRRSRSRSPAARRRSRSGGRARRVRDASRSASASPVGNGYKNGSRSPAAGRSYRSPAHSRSPRSRSRSHSR